MVLSKYKWIPPPWMAGAPKLKNLKNTTQGTPRRERPDRRADQVGRRTDWVNSAGASAVVFRKHSQEEQTGSAEEQTGLALREPQLRSSTSTGSRKSRSGRWCGNLGCGLPQVRF